ncbi:uncharacterized protein LOC128361983 [Scomber scombrus]|uniref:Uncharacterized protein LOC128361983 n=1 Tax=Scomber scombrus TaxID=13677 RepID=A0AAV1QBH4_SCOSC
MKLILTLTLIWTLSTTAEVLKCFVGEGSSSSSQTCEAGEICAAVARKVDGKKTSAKCVPPSLFSVGNHTLSLNIGDGSVTAAVRVCDKDDCNNQTIPYPGDQEKNNLKCYTCDDKSPPVCNKTVQCEGVQDRCINGINATSAGKYAFFGCVSENLCNAARLEFLMADKGLDQPKCCKGNLCNSAWSVQLNVIPLLFGLFTLIFY